MVCSNDDSRGGRVDAAELPLPRWEVELIGDEWDLRRLVNDFVGGPRRIYKDEGQDRTLMVIDGLPEDASSGDVRAAAEHDAAMLTGALMAVDDAVSPISVGAVVQRSIDGEKRHVYATMNVAARARVEMHGEILQRDAHGRLVPKPSPPSRPALFFQLAESEPVVQKAMRLSAADDAGSWTGLYRLYELMVQDAGGPTVVANSGWASRTQQERFKHSANSPRVSGDASRHGHAGGTPPSNPMTLDEARSFVKGIRDAWLNMRLTQ